MDTSIARLAANEGITSRQIDFLITRSYVTWTVVAFSIVLTWILIISVIGMAVSVLFSRRTSEIGMLAFFWGYAVAIVAIGIVAADWLWRRAKDEEADRATRAQEAAEAGQAATAQLLAAEALAGDAPGGEASAGPDSGSAADTHAYGAGAEGPDGRDAAD